MDKSASKKHNFLTAVVANSEGNIFDLPGYAAVGMADQSLVPLTVEKTKEMPHGSELMFLSDRRPILYNRDQGCFEALCDNPYRPEEKIYPVAVFNSPGYISSYISAFKENRGAKYLPLFSYGAVGWYRGKFRSAAILVDNEKRQDIKLMKQENVVAGVHQMRKQMPSNRLIAHLAQCALSYGCPAGKNFFLGRYEAPLPSSSHCNARCLGCISLQKNTDIPCSQDRIDFTPTPEEIAEVALAHIYGVKNSIVSFGQGCEGDPLLAAEVIEPAIVMIRAATQRGTIHLNTNGSRPHILKNLFNAGLDSVRISMSSVRKECYHKYFRPQSYGFEHVLNSFAVALDRGKFVSINYLNCPGFTDTPEELGALIKFIEQYPVDMIQWRNLNFDPIRYWKIMNRMKCHSQPIGMESVLNKIRILFPNMKYGYFNPPKEKFKRWRRWNSK
jgi:pyruvate-formate lyase-activating enzyme